MSRQCPEPRDRDRDFAALYMAKTTGFVRSWWFSFTFGRKDPASDYGEAAQGLFKSSSPQSRIFSPSLSPNILRFRGYSYMM